MKENDVDHFDFVFVFICINITLHTFSVNHMKWLGGRAWGERAQWFTYRYRSQAPSASSGQNDPRLFTYLYIPRNLFGTNSSAR